MCNLWAPADISADVKSLHDNGNNRKKIPDLSVIDSKILLFVGLLPILNNLIELGLLVDVQLSFRIQVQIVQLLSRVINAKNSELVIYFISIVSFLICIISMHVLRRHL